MDSIFSLRAGDGAFADKTGTARSTTTVTAAALVLLGRLGQTIDPHAVSCLTSRMKHGGFLAAPSAPVPDLLSTATALFALNTIQYQIDDLPGQIFEFIDACWLEDGGFAGHVLDTVSDCEYTWYGLLSLGCLTGVEACIE